MFVHVFSVTSLILSALAAPSIPYGGYGHPDCSYTVRPCQCPSGTTFWNSTTSAVIGANVRDVKDVIGSCKHSPYLMNWYLSHFWHCYFSKFSIRHGSALLRPAPLVMTTLWAQLVVLLAHLTLAPSRSLKRLAELLTGPGYYRYIGLTFSVQPDTQHQREGGRIFHCEIRTKKW